MNRRSFMTSILAMAAAPAIVRAESLMPGRGILIPMWSDGPLDWGTGEIKLRPIWVWSGAQVGGDGTTPMKAFRSISEAMKESQSININVVNSHIEPGPLDHLVIVDKTIRFMPKSEPFGGTFLP